MTLKNDRALALKAARELADKYRETMTEDQRAEIKAAVDKVYEIDEKLEQAAKSRELLKSVGALREVAEDAAPAEVKAATLGEHFVKAARDGLREQAAGARLNIVGTEFKAAGDPYKRPTGDGAAWGTTFDRAIVNAHREQLVAADLMGSATVSNATIKYLVEKANRIAEGAVGFVAEGGKKPYVNFTTFDVVTESLTKVAALTKLTDEMISDYGFIADWINNNLVYELSVAEEKQLLNGDGTSNGIKGLLNRDGVQAKTGTGVDTWSDTIFEAMGMVQQSTTLTADGLVINPADYQPLRLSKDKNGQYYAGGPFAGPYGNGGIQVNPGPWGLRTVVTNAVPQGTALVGAFKQGATVLRKGGLRVDSTNTNADDFENNLVTVRAEERLGLMVPAPAAFVKLTLTA